MTNPLNEALWYDAELAGLREANEAKKERIEALEVSWDELEAELARLHKQLEAANRVWKDEEAENARLRENYDAAVGEAEAQAAEVERLREEKDIYERYVNGEMTVTELRNALKETT